MSVVLHSAVDVVLLIARELAGLVTARSMLIVPLFVAKPMVRVPKLGASVRTSKAPLFQSIDAAAVLRPRLALSETRMKPPAGCNTPVKV